jgi:hypothetical protein
MTKKTLQSKVTIFDWLNNITYYKKPWNEFNNDDYASFEPYLINRYVSMNKGYIDLVNVVQKIPSTEKEKIHNVYLTLLPKNKMFLKYIKKQPKNKYGDILKYISEYYECSLGEAEDYIDIIREPGVRSVLWDMGVDEKETNKLIKNAKF